MDATGPQRRSIIEEAEEALSDPREAMPPADDGLERAKESLREAVDKASAYAEDLYAEGRVTLERGAASLNARVERQPVFAILLACAAGYLIGALVRGRRG